MNMLDMLGQKYKSRTSSFWLTPLVNMLDMFGLKYKFLSKMLTEIQISVQDVVVTTSSALAVAGGQSTAITRILSFWI